MRIEADDYDLVQVIGMYTPLRKDGQTYKGVDHDSLVVDPRKNVFNWNSKGVHGDVFTWVEHVYGTDFLGAKEIIAQNFTKTFSPGLVSNEKIYTKLDWYLAEEHHSNMDAEDWDWWVGRGVRKSTVKTLLLGRHGNWYTIPIPDWSGKHLANYKLRARYPDMKIRYRQFTKGLEPILYIPRPSLMANTDTVVFVAGEIKAIVLAQAGIPAVSSSTGCSTWRTEWGVWFRERQVVQCFDPGEQEAADKVRRQMAHDVPSARVINVLPPNGWDIDDWIVKHGASDREVRDLLHV